MKIPNGWKLVPLCPYAEDSILATQWNRGLQGLDSQKAVVGTAVERAWLEGRLAAHAVPPDDSLRQPPGDDLAEFENHFSLRTIHCLKSAGILTFPALKSSTKNDLLKIPNFGKQSLKEVKIALQKKYPELDDGDALR